MNQTTHEPLHLTGEELAILSELLETAHTNLLFEIRHTDHRSYRDVLRRRLELMERLIRLCRPQSHAQAAETQSSSGEHVSGAGGG